MRFVVFRLKHMAAFQTWIEKLKQCDFSGACVIFELTLLCTIYTIKYLHSQ